MKPIETNAAAPQLTRGAAPITERQVEIMTARLCEAIADRKFASSSGDEAVAALIGAMVEQVSRLNEAVAAPTEPEARMAIDRLGRPVLIESAGGVRAAKLNNHCS